MININDLPFEIQPSSKNTIDFSKLEYGKKKDPIDIIKQMDLNILDKINRITNHLLIEKCGIFDRDMARFLAISSFKDDKQYKHLYLKEVQYMKKQLKKIKKKMNKGKNNKKK